MSEPKPKKGEAKAKTGVVGWIVRVTIWGAVLAAAVVVLLDVRARRAAQATANAWSQAHREHDEKDRDFVKEELKPLISGSPVERPPARVSPDAEFEVEEYVWSSPFREHVVQVRYLKDQTRAIVDIGTPEKE